MSEPLFVSRLSASRARSVADSDYERAIELMRKNPSSVEEILGKMSIKALALYHLKARGVEDTSDRSIYFAEVDRLRALYPERSIDYSTFDIDRFSY